MKRAVAVVALLLLTNVAHSQEWPCTADKAAALANLAANYGEHPVGQGLNSKGAVDIVVANPTTGSWSALVILPDGRACVLATGKGWVSVSWGERA